VREALAERERLWAIAPHIIGRCGSSCRMGARTAPALAAAAGPVPLRPYGGSRKALPATQSVSLDRSSGRCAAQAGIYQGFVYSDCWVDDARLVVLNARDAADRGAQVRTRCPVTALNARGRGLADRNAAGHSSAPAPWSTLPGRGVAYGLWGSPGAAANQPHAAGARFAHRCALACSTMPSPISSSFPTGASFSPFPMSGTSP
jgi:hypothetical protein